MKYQGLNKQAVEESRRVNGTNALTQIPPDPLWKKILEGFKDPMIIILCVALVIQFVLFLWFGVRPVTAVVVAVVMTGLVHWFFSSLMRVPLPRGVLDSVL